MKIAIGCIMLCMFLAGMVCGMGFTVGWKATICIWSASIVLIGWIVLAIVMLLSKTTKTPQAGSLKGQ